MCNVKLEEPEKKSDFTTGFFCLVPFINRTNLIPTLITMNRDNNNSRAIDLQNDAKIKISFNDNEFRELKLSKDRKINLFFYFSEGNYFSSSLGIIKGIIRCKYHKDDYAFYTCKTTFGSLGAPIILKDSKKVIGIHLGKYEEEYF